MSGGIYENIKCKTKRKNTFIPTDYQSYVVDYFINRSTYKGLLLYHKLGAGKTCTSVLIADELIRTNKIQKVYVLTPGSLRVNWIDEYCKKCGDNFITQNFIFMTYNSNLQLRLKDYDFNNSLIIVDEAHNLINGVKNMSKNPYLTYKKIYESNCRVLLLTGTPIIQYTWEWSIMGNLLNPDGFINIIDISTRTILPTKFSVSYKNKQDENYKGIVSYYPGDPSLYPAINYKKPIKCQMISYQYIYLQDQMRIDRITIAMGPPKRGDPKYKEKHTRYIRAVKAITTRSISNCYFYDPLIQIYSLLAEIIPNSLDKIIGFCKEELENLEKIDDVEDKKILKLRKKVYQLKIDVCEVDKKLHYIRFQIFRNGFDKKINFQTLSLFDPSLYPGVNNEFLVQMADKKAKMDEAQEKLTKNINKLSSRYNILVRFKGEEEYLNAVEKNYQGEIKEREEAKGETIDDEDKDIEEEKEEEVYIKFLTSWIDDDLFFSNYDNILINLSRKYVSLITNIVSRLHTKHVVFSFFKTGIGFEMIGKLLKRANITYGIFSGDIDDKERRRILEVFNSPENRDGKLMNVLLITEAGAEGISLLETNNMHILESSTKEHKITQAIGRVARIYSHVNMPKNRQYVNIWRYWSTSSKKTQRKVNQIFAARGEKRKDILKNLERIGFEDTNIEGVNIEETSKFVGIDEFLYNKGVEAEGIKNQFLQEKLIANCIENVLPTVMPAKPITYGKKLGKQTVTVESQDIKFKDADVLSRRNVYAFLPMTTSTTLFPSISVEFMNKHSLPLPYREELINQWATKETRNVPGTYSLLRAPDGVNVILAYIQKTVRSASNTTSDTLKNGSDTIGDRIKNVYSILESVVKKIPPDSTIIFNRTLGGTAGEPLHMSAMHDTINYVSNRNPNLKFILYR